VLRRAVRSTGRRGPERRGQRVPAQRRAPARQGARAPRPERDREPQLEIGELRLETGEPRLETGPGLLVPGREPRHAPARPAQSLERLEAGPERLEPGPARLPRGAQAPADVEQRGLRLARRLAQGAEEASPTPGEPLPTSTRPAGRPRLRPKGARGPTLIVEVTSAPSTPAAE
jgi:hypothetical protein